MMRYFRLAAALLASRSRSRLTVEGESRITFRVWPTDVDVSIANNAAVLTIMETGRIDLMVRSGFFALARKNKWYFPLRSIRVQFIRPLKLFQKAELTTRILHADNEWVYIKHAITRNGKDVALAMAKATVKKGREKVPLERIAKELGTTRLPRDGQEIAEVFEREEQLL